MPVSTGLDILAREFSPSLAGARAGLICHPASIDADYRHAIDLLHAKSDFQLSTLFGPQHGIRGETQDDMIEWEGYRDPATGLQVYSLYGRTRRPGSRMLSQIDILLFDLQDVGARPYTFIYTMALAMDACREFNKRFVVLDRPNPIGGARIEGNVLDPKFRSFVGFHPSPMRHGMTAGEIALYFNREFAIGCDLEVVEMRGWTRGMLFPDTGLPWVMPSPNIPAFETTLVYPGMVLLEGTNVSEGRGTTRPFEISGAPWIDPAQLVQALSRFDLPGVHFRPLHFQPTFHKWAGERVGGVQIHVLDPDAFPPFRCGLAFLMAYRELGGEHFQWKQPPYEYEYEKLPIDILLGTDRIRHDIEAGRPLAEIEAAWGDELERFRQTRARYLLYPELLPQEGD